MPPRPQARPAAGFAESRMGAAAPLTGAGGSAYLSMLLAFTTRNPMAQSMMMRMTTTYNPLKMMEMAFMTTNPFNNRRKSNDIILKEEPTSLTDPPPPWGVLPPGGPFGMMSGCGDCAKRVAWIQT